MGKFQGILGMDWLSKNQAKINYQKGTILFISSTGHKVSIQGRSGKNPLKVVKSNKLVKGLQKGLPIFILKINKPRPEEKSQDPPWLEEFQDVFLEEISSW